MSEKKCLKNIHSKDGVKVIHRYKISDYEEEKKYWQQWEKEMNKRLKDSSYEINWDNDSGWKYED